MRSGGLPPSRDQSPGTSTSTCPFTSYVARLKATSEEGGGRVLAATSLTCRIKGGVGSPSPLLRSSLKIITMDLVVPKRKALDGPKLYGNLTRSRL